MIIKREFVSFFRTKPTEVSVAAASTSATTAHTFKQECNIFDNIPRAPSDPILGITGDFNVDLNPQKVNLSVGAYRTSEGKPWILPSIKMASNFLHDDSNKEYTNTNGSESYQQKVKQFLYGSFTTGKKFIKEDRISIAQSLSGTGSLKLTAEFINKWLNIHDIYIPNPTWTNHLDIFSTSGVQPHYYKYFDTQTNSINHKQLLNDLKNAKLGSAVLFHACCHNPTGLDPTKSQWLDIIDIVIKNQLIPIIDIAYQGFKTGSLTKDLHLLKLVSNKIDQGLIPTMFVCQSFAKNMGLYGERIGSLSVITKDSEFKQNIDTQLQKIIRAMYSSPPIHGAKLVEIVLSQPEIYSQWEKDILVMFNRIKNTRTVLYEKLLEKGLNWGHLTKQNGMFCFTGLKEEQILKLRNDYSIYCTLDGRFSISNINPSNVNYLADSIDKVLRN